MKKIIFIFLIILLSGACSEYLDVEHLLENTMEIQTVFESKDYSDQWLAAVYAHLGKENMDVSSKGSMPFNLISDDMYFNDRRKTSNRPYNKFKNGEYTESDEQSSWESCYQGIRDASTYLRYIGNCKELTQDEITDRKAQARFARAYLYWLLLRKYGPIPILPDEGLDFTKEYEDLAIPRSTYEACAEFIAGELAIAARDLPQGLRDNRDVARPTKGAALAARAKVYLYSASPLFNGNTDPWAAQLVDHEGNRLVSETVDETKWAKAAAAAKEVMDLGVYELHTVPFRDLPYDNSKKGYNQWMTFDYYYYPATIAPPHHEIYSNNNWPEGWKNIDPFESYRQVFNGDMRAWGSTELIFTRGVNQEHNEDIKALVAHQMPRSLNGWGTHGLTLKMYDTYYMNNGDDFPSGNRPQGYTNNDPASPNYYANYLPLPPNVSLQHARREPRFYASVAYNGSIWECERNPDQNDKEHRYKQVFYYRDSNDGKLPGETEFYLPTGIGIKKYYNPRDYRRNTNDYEGITFKPEPAIRYAEVLLIYAEALNELASSHVIPTYDGTTSISVSRDVAEMNRAIKQIRIRAGLPNFEAAVYQSQDEFRKKLKRERQIELMGEGHRYFDLRRWKDAPTEEAELVTGFDMNMPSSQKERFDTPVEVLSLPSVFINKMYLWPISHSELKKNRKLTQNPGWTYFTD
ncbi:MAG: RagB/SusD family nutrient uptake outer membrane protein [Prevotellaceae bacterium]|nr:RagB/SusD family nutrient uptake outer membrane protein [Prevotellaceae bacterium]